MMKILSKSKLLPAVKSLTRFRYVNYMPSRSFQNSCFNFITKYHDQQKKDNLNLLLLRSADQSPDDPNIVGSYYFSLLSTENLSVKENIYFPFPKYIHTEVYGYCNDPPKVYGPCNGLLCLEFKHCDYLSCDCDYDLALWNPSTKEIKYLPRKTIQRPPLAHPSTHGYTQFLGSGFGFDSKSQDYKVVKFILQYFSCSQLDDGDFQTHLYSLKSNHFKEMEPFPEMDAKILEVQNRSCYINGIHYWIAFEEYRYEEYYFILSFDFASEKFSTISIPNFSGLINGLERREHMELIFQEKKKYGMELLDFNGSLGALVYPLEGTEEYSDPSERTEKSFDLWVMNNGTWTRKFSIESVPGIERPLGFWKNGELMFLLSSNQELLLFDPATREIKNLGCSGTKQIIAYTESLVPINGRSELEERMIRQRFMTN